MMSSLISAFRHPDKNKNPEAEDTFVKITQSYEVIFICNNKVTFFHMCILHKSEESWCVFNHSSQILSNEEKRDSYDRYGTVDNTHSYAHRGFGHFHDNFFDESYFHFPFNNKGGRDSDSKYTLHFNQYVNEVVPESFKRPYLIKITSDWCLSCIHIEPVWKETVEELETLGEKWW